MTLPNFNEDRESFCHGNLKGRKIFIGVTIFTKCEVT